LPGTHHCDGRAPHLGVALNNLRCRAKTLNGVAQADIQRLRALDPSFDKRRRSTPEEVLDRVEAYVAKHDRPPSRWDSDGALPPIGSSLANLRNRVKSGRTVLSETQLERLRAFDRHLFPTKSRRDSPPPTRLTCSSSSVPPFSPHSPSCRRETGGTEETEEIEEIEEHEPPPLP